MSCLLTQSVLVKQVSEVAADADTALLVLDRDLPGYAEGATPDAPVGDLAFVIYTSGSTGQPKGVRIPHASMSYYVEAMQQALGIGEQDRYLHTASLAFSSSNRQMLLPLSCGAAVVMATAEQLRDPLALFGLIKVLQVTVIDLVPSHWRSFLNALSRLEEKPRRDLLNNSLRLLLLASEAAVGCA